jgi:hypothetical protein
MSTQSNSGGVGFGGLLALLFIGLKLGHVITWPWIWVLSPLWISFIIWLFIMGMIGLTIGVFALLERRARRKRQALHEQRLAEARARRGMRV